MGVSYLLDTHAFIWLVSSRRTPPVEVTSALQAPGARVLVSAVSAFEVSTKVRLGKLPEGGVLVERWAESVRRLGGLPLDLTMQHALDAGRLDWAHRDPFDRLIVAQALAEDLTLITADRALADAPGLSLLQWR
jgi:PIN domain nuclease of toxin-antitoxin system